MQIHQSSLHDFIEKYFCHDLSAQQLYPVAMAIIDVSGQFVYANTRYINVYDLNADCLETYNLLDLSINEKHAIELKQHLTWLREDRPYPTPYIGLNKTLSGDILHVRVDWDYITYKDDVLGYLSVITNMSEQIPNIESYRANEAIVNAMMETTLWGVLIASIDGSVIELNPLCMDILHESKQDIIGRSLSDVLEPLDTKQNGDWAQKKRLDHHPLSEYRLKKKVQNMKRFVLLESATMVTYKSIASTIIFVKDITLEKNKEHALAAKKQELEAHYRHTLLQEMISGMAHEMNQPLSAITNYVQGSIRRIQDGSDTREIIETLEMVVRQAKRASSIIEHMRSWDQNELEDYRVIETKQLIKDCVRLIEFEMMQAKIELEQFISLDCPNVFGCQIQLEQVFINLLKNAIDAILQNVKVNRFASKRISIEVQREAGDRVSVIIRDSGIGITAYAASHLFEPFFTTKSDGMGIGLALCEKIIHDHHGTLIYKQCEDGYNTAFIVNLPVHHVQHSQDACLKQEVLG